jgi:hypothetical protein
MSEKISSECAEMIYYLQDKVRELERDVVAAQARIAVLVGALQHAGFFLVWADARAPENGTLKAMESEFGKFAVTGPHEALEVVRASPTAPDLALGRRLAEVAALQARIAGGTCSRMTSGRVVRRSHPAGDATRTGAAGTVHCATSARRKRSLYGLRVSAAS